MAATSTRQFLENSIIIWFNPMIENTQQSIERLRQIVNVVQVFNDQQSFMNYVVDIVDERVLLIISKNISETMIELVHQLPQIDSIYLFNSNEQPYHVSNMRKLKGIAHDIESLYQIIQSHIRRSEHEDVAFNLIGNFSSFSNDQTNRQEAAFMYTQLLKDIFIEMKDDNKDEMISFCREQYADNPYVSQFIVEFEKNYKSNETINWYTRESILYKVLNKALRTQNIQVLYKIRTFIRNLHFHLLECYQEQNNNSITQIVYRGQRMSINEFQKIQNNKGGLFSVSNFFSTTEDQSLAMIYAGVSNDDETAMIFEIQIEPSLTDSTRPFANIQNLSTFGEAEKEWLFSFGCVFRIVDIKQGIHSEPWHIHLLLTNEFDQQLKMMTEHFRSDIYIGLLLPIHSLGKLSYKMGKYMAATDYYIMALKSESDWRGKIMILAELGQTYERLAHFDSALTCFQKALSMHEELDDKQINDYHRLAEVYIGIATVYTAKQDKDQPLHYLNLAVKTELNLEQPSKEILLNCYNDIGFIHFVKQNYDQSLLSYQTALDIAVKIYPSTHPDIGTIHMNIGNTYQAQNLLKDALENLKKSLDIQLASLPGDHPDIARSFNNISSIYHSMGHYEDALSYCKNALNIYSKRMPQNHPNLAILYNNIIQLYDKLGHLNESLDYRYKKLDIYLATLQPDDTRIGISYNTIAATLAALRRFDEAAEYALKAHEFTTRVFGVNHIATQTCAKNLEDILNRR